MKKFFIFTISILAIFLFNTCALEIANVLGPDGGYVFYDKKSYTLGWRYIQCSPHDFGELRGNWNNQIEKENIINAALIRCKDNSADWHKYGWELPTEADLRKMLECFSYGLTRFSDEYYYLCVDNLYAAGRYWFCTDTTCPQGSGVKNTGSHCPECMAVAPADNKWTIEKDAPPNPDLLTDPTDSKNWVVKVFHKNFSEELNGAIEEIKDPSVLGDNPIRVRAIRRF